MVLLSGKQDYRSGKVSRINGIRLKFLTQKIRIWRNGRIVCIGGRIHFTNLSQGHTCYRLLTDKFTHRTFGF